MDRLPGEKVIVNTEMMLDSKLKTVSYKGTVMSKTKDEIVIRSDSTQEQRAYRLPLSNNTTITRK